MFRSYASANAGQKQRWSYAHGPSDAPLLGSTIGQALQDWVELRPSKEAAVFCTGNIRKTFQQILEEVKVWLIRRYSVNNSILIPPTIKWEAFKTLQACLLSYADLHMVVTRSFLMESSNSLHTLYFQTIKECVWGEVGRHLFLCQK